ncbi:hypothetical protein SAMN04487786_0076 [Paenisporosarcina quisquiliarum]|nr:hypothetical protein SAMN04487786_0076 [Paenisporosarcina quisquiliarum]
MRKIIFPLFYVCEWVLFFCVLVFLFIFNLTNIFNLIYIDMPWEEQISLTSSSMKPLLWVLGMGLIIYFYIRYLIGNRIYKIIKLVIWTLLFGLNSFICMLWLSVNDTNLYKNDRILLLLIILFSIIFTIQTILKFRNEIR